MVRPQVAQAPIAIAHFGSGIWSHSGGRWGPIFSVTVAGDDHQVRLWARIAVARKDLGSRSATCRAGGSMTAIISMAQQARPNCIGQMAERRPS